MTRIALNTPSASQRLALRRWLHARGHEVCALEEAELVLGERVETTDLTVRPVPFVDGSSARRIDFDQLERVLADFVMDRRELLDIEGPAIDGLVARSAGMQELEARIERLASVGLSVLITGESGSGKEVVARELHRRGASRQEPFVAVNCAAIPEGLFESELFGHERGSFTDAARRRHGYFEQAGAGTLFLDEIGELPPTVQAKLLRALQDRRFYRLGAEEPIEFRARVLSATAVDLESDPGFRTDLYHRLAGARLRVPPLRERADDLPDLCRMILSRHRDHAIRAIERGALARLAALEWAGNVRQLENVLSQAAIFAPGPVLDLQALDPFLQGGRSAEGSWFQDALRAWVSARQAAGHSPAELREELLDRLRGVEQQLDLPANQGSNPKLPES